jgi:hypothetical protein
MNWLIANGSGAPIRVAYDSNPATFVTNIANALGQASKTANDYMTLESVSYLNMVSRVNWKTWGLGNKFGNRRLMMTGPNSYRYMSSLSTAGSAAFLRKSTYSEKIASMAWQNDIGELPGEIVPILDDRAPILVYDIPNNTFQIVYRGVHPEFDPRQLYKSSATQAVFDINVVAGQSFLTRGKVTDPVYRDQDKDFSRIQQVAVLANEGYSLTEFDDGDQSAQNSTSRVNQGGGLFLTYIP